MKKQILKIITKEACAIIYQNLRFLFEKNNLREQLSVCIIPILYCMHVRMQLYDTQLRT